MKYSLATQLDARAQGHKSQWHLRVKGLEWKFAQRQELKDLDVNNLLKMKAWLKANAWHAPIATPEPLKEAIERLECWLGSPSWEPTKNKTGFARVSTIRIKGRYSTAGPVRMTTYKETERYNYHHELKDGHKKESSEAAKDALTQNVFVSVTCADIVEQFLAVSGYGSFLHAVLNMQDKAPGGYRVYAHVDWYPLRTYAAQDWHKDTRGSTLFVALIYMNQGKIQGPDVILNPWPLRDTGPDQSWEASRTPCALPPWLKNPIDGILQENKATNEKMMIMQTGEVPAGGGMVWFVDELIHHKTPGGAAIPKSGEVSFSISESKLGNIPLDKLGAPAQWDKFDSKAEPRKFIRIWVTVDKTG